MSAPTDPSPRNRRQHGRLRRRLHDLRAPIARALRPLRAALARLRGGPDGAREIHLMWSGAPSRSLTVGWATAARIEAPSVQFRSADDAPWQETAARSVRRPGSFGHLHTAVLEPLEPGRRYAYRVSCGPGHAERFSPVHSARTAPADPAARFEAVFLCDVGLGGRADGTTGAVPAVISAIRAGDPLLVLGGGDYAYANRDPRFLDPGDAIGAWFDQMQPLLAESVFMPQLGNHETELAERTADWAPRLPPPSASGSGFSRSFDVGAAHFVGLHAPGRAPTASDLEWLADDLRSAAAIAARWRIVYQHAPVFAHGSSHPARAELQRLMTLFDQLGVDLHLSGHDQNYERTHPIRADGTTQPPESPAGRSLYRAGRGVVYAKVSPAGKLSDRGLGFSRLRGDRPPVIAARDDSAHHWARLVIDAHELRVVVEGLAGAGEAPSIFDEFSLVRPPE